MKLADLQLDNARLDRNQAGIDISGIAADSRKVKPGFLFFAIAGAKAHGAHFARQAVAAGAVAVAAEQRPAGLPASVAFVPVSNARRALALAAAKFFPRQPGTIAAVTGTSGKTSVAAFTRQIWAALGFSAASIGTIGVVSPKGEKYGSLTTPDPVELHRTLDQLAGEGVTHLALEASSHGLDQHRLDGVRIAAGAFTNLSRDHLDYHPTIEAYLAAKLRLFEELIVPNGTAVIDVDDCYADQVIEAAKKRGLKVMTVGVQGNDIRLVSGAIDGFAQAVTIAHGGREFKIKLPLVGAFQV
ncbi:MAG: Mur ligase family protein, partial [Pseudolabrys sp.]